MIVYALATIVVVCSCCAAGRLVAGNRSLPFAVLFPLGMAILSSAFFGILSLGWGSRLGFMVVGIAPLVAAVALFGSTISFRPSWKLSRDPLVWIVCAYAIHYFVHSLAPETGYDSSGYHLGLSAEWLRLGHFPNRVGFYELLPQSFETLYAYALALGGGSVGAKLVHFTCLIASVALLYPTARLLNLPSWTASATAVIFISIPAVGTDAASAYTELAFTLGFVATFYLSVAAWKHSSGHLWFLGGLAAGFCYGVKLPGLIAPGAIGLFLLFNRRWKDLGLFAAGSALVLVPWAGRSWWMTGNPLAPLFNAVFRNPYFRLAMERGFLETDRNIGGAKWYEIAPELAFYGRKLGLAGPLVLLLPFGLLGLLRKNTRPLAIFGLGLLGIYSQHIAARFLLPAYLFLMMSLMALLPRRAALAAAWAAVLLCSPFLAVRYAEPSSVLGAWPWKVAIGVETQETYLRRSMTMYPFAELVRNRIPEGSLVWDCAGLPSFYAHAVTMMYWQSEDMMLVYRSLLRASGQDPWRLTSSRYTYPPREITAMRLRGSSIVEVVPDVPGWSSTASPWPRDARWSHDGNLLTDWDADEGLESRASLEFAWPHPVVTTSLKQVTTAVQATQFRDRNGRWSDLAGARIETEAVASDLRPGVASLFRDLGFHYITIPVSGGLQIRWSADFMRQPERWGFRSLGCASDTCLYGLLEPTTVSRP